MIIFPWEINSPCDYLVLLLNEEKEKLHHYLLFVGEAGSGAKATRLFLRCVGSNICSLVAGYEN